ncbi:MAG: hypothetical protein QNJ36_17995 [Calothrix sp. MO_167.B42]|nr:hypothetical protein [Calothrix sp. MO_167.B42]
MTNNFPPELLQAKNWTHEEKIKAYALPLMPLRERDWKVLVQLFDREDSEEIADNINSKLLMMMPEPFWEDDPFDFLYEYL